MKNDSTDLWLRIVKPNGEIVSTYSSSGMGSFKIKAEENKEKAFEEEDERYEKAEEGVVPREGTITVTQTDEFGVPVKVHTIAVTQLDKISAFFAQINSNGTISQRDSTVYNHKLATWAAKVSYRAYQPHPSPSGPPSWIKIDASETINKILGENGFIHIDRKNIGVHHMTQHTFAYRTIAAPGNTQTRKNEEGGFDNDTIAATLDDVGAFQRSYYGVPDSTLVDDNRSITSNGRPLVIVAIRGSKTGLFGGGAPALQRAGHGARAQQKAGGAGRGRGGAAADGGAGVRCRGRRPRRPWGG